jgi:hypothetical protein
MWPRAAVFEGKRKELLSIEISFDFKYSPIAW